MKNFALMFLIVLYCFVISIYSSATTPFSINNNNTHTTTDESFLAIASSSIFYHSNQTEVLVFDSNKLPSTSSRNQLFAFIFSLSGAESILANRLTNSFTRTTNILIKFAKHDIIFPFHAYW